MLALWKRFSYKQKLSKHRKLTCSMVVARIRDEGYRLVLFETEEHQQVGELMIFAPSDCGVKVGDTIKYKPDFFSYYEADRSNKYGTFIEVMASNA